MVQGQVFLKKGRGKGVGLGQEGLSEGWGNCVKYLKRRWNRKDGMGNKKIKKGGKLGQVVVALKRRSWNPLTSYVTCTRCHSLNGYILKCFQCFLGVLGL